MLRGFELGADDYVTKPFPISVFRKKIAALLSRLQKQSGGDCYDDGNLLINFTEMSAAPGGPGRFLHAVRIPAAQGADEKSTDRTHAAGVAGKAVGRG